MSRSTRQGVTKTARDAMACKMSSQRAILPEISSSHFLYSDITGSSNEQYKSSQSPLLDVFYGVRSISVSSLLDVVMKGLVNEPVSEVSAVELVYTYKMENITV